MRQPIRQRDRFTAVVTRLQQFHRVQVADVHIRPQLAGLARRCPCPTGPYPDHQYRPPKPTPSPSNGQRSATPRPPRGNEFSICSFSGMLFQSNTGKGRSYGFKRLQPAGSCFQRTHNRRLAVDVRLGQLAAHIRKIIGVENASQTQVCLIFALTTYPFQPNTVTSCAAR